MSRNHSCGGVSSGWCGEYFLTLRLRTLLGPPLTDTGCHAHNGLEIKVCIRTFRLFFVSHTKDYFYRFSDRTRKEGMQKLQEVDRKRKDQFDGWLAKQRAKLAAKET